MIGNKLAHYEILDLVGKGGMGEVYRARDSKLGREVAVKVLPRELSADPERSARFEREARALASLQHPNVAAIYGFEEADGVRFLVMELVPGETLASRIAQGALPHGEVLGIARQIAAGLEAAHDRGIVHRDLKPANLMLTPEGEVKILDFGLARAWFGDGSGDSDPSASPTITAAMTQAGTILGTAAYMSPEQARGRSVDRRADIWAFGVIVWEMLTGARLFEGETISDTLAAVLRAEPDWTLLPAEEAPLLCRVVERCLVRDPRQRLRDIGEARILLQEGGGTASLLSYSGWIAPAETSELAQPRRSPWPILALVGVICLALGAILGSRLLAPGVEAPVVHAMIPPPRDFEFDLRSAAPGPAVISPDGKMVAFTAHGAQGIAHLFLRHLDREDAASLSGTEGAAYPFWSPDSQSIGFFTVNPATGAQRLKKVSVSGGPPVSLCSAANGKGGSWNEQGVIVFAPAHNQPIFRVPSIGGEPEAVTQLDAAIISHRHPRFLPNGREFLYLARRSESEQLHEIRLASLETGEHRVVTESECQAEFAGGQLLTVRDRVLFATPFDRAKGELTGGGTPLVENLLIISAGAAMGSYSVSPAGPIVYQTGFSGSLRALEWVDTASGGISSVGTTGQLFHPKLSPDGSRCVVEVRAESGAGVDLWIVDLSSGLRTRFTFDLGDEFSPVWAPDGTSIFYTASQDNFYQVVQQPVDGIGGSVILYESEIGLRTTSVDPTGSELLVDVQRADSALDIAILPLNPQGELRDVLVTSDDEAGGVFSPDGRWIAYHAQGTSTWEVFVMPASGGPRKWQITTQGAVYPQWSADGRELLVSGFGGDVVAYTVDPTGASFRVEGSRVIAKTDPPSSVGVAYSPHPDGQRLVRAGPEPSAKDETSFVHIVTDWRRALGR